MNATAQKIKLAQEKSIEWIEYLAAKSQQNLERRLRINHLQFAIAVKEKKEDVCELLNIMERIIIEAQLYKQENNIPDAADEIEQTIAEIETVTELSEDRQKVLNEFHQDRPQTQPTSSIENNDTQLSLF